MTSTTWLGENKKAIVVVESFVRVVALKRTRGKNIYLQ
jgi:hypothetical protein